MLKLAVEIETVVDAGAVADDQRRTIVCFRFLENLQGLGVVCTEGDTAHVNVLVAHGDEAEVLLAGALTSGSEEGDCATVRGLGSLSTGVGVHFGIEDADVHVFARSHHVVETTVTDVVCPTVTTEDPHGLLHEVVGEFVAEADRCVVGCTGEGCLQGGNVFTLGLDAGFVGLILGRELFLEFGRNVHGFEEAQSLLGMLRDSEAHTETEFGVVFEEAVGPSGAAAFLVLCPRSGREVTAVNGGATRSVGDNHAVTEQLRNETHVSGFAAACAGAGEFEQRFEEHGLLDEVLVDLGAVEFREIDEEVPALAFLNLDGFLRHHVDGLLGFVGLVLTDTGLRTNAATRTVVAGHGNSEHRLVGTFELEALGRGVLEAFRSVLHGGFVNDLHADGCMRADHGALAALHASVRIPGRDVEGEVALFVLGGSGREHAVARHLGDGEEFAVALDDFCGGGVVYGRSPHGPCGSGYILGAIGFAYACRSPPRTKPRCAGLVPKGSLSLTHIALTRR